MLTIFLAYDIIRMYQVNMKTYFIKNNIKLVIFKAKHKNRTSLKLLIFLCLKTIKKFLKKFLKKC